MLGARFWTTLFVIFLAPLSAAAIWLLIAAGASTVLFLLEGKGVTRTEFVFLFLNFIDLYATYLLLWVPFAWFLMCFGAAGKWVLQRKVFSRDLLFFPNWPSLCVGGLLCLPVAAASASLPVDGPEVLPLLTSTGVILCFTTAMIYCNLLGNQTRLEKVSD